MDEHSWVAEQFETHRSHLQAVAYRLLGSVSEADDAVQETWLRLHRSDVAEVRNLGGWLTTVVGRVCLDMLRARATRREEPLGAHGTDIPDSSTDDPEQDAVLADSVGVALLLVLDTLKPAERFAFVLHDIFAVPYREIAHILDRRPDATKMLASRARRRIQTADRIPDTDPVRQRAVVTAFLAASRAGDFDGLLALLHPDAVLRPDPAAAQLGTVAEIHGATSIAKQFAGRAQAARPALINGIVGAAWAPGGRLRAVFDFTITDGRITAVHVIADPHHIDQLDVEFLTH